jgi:cytoskeletal protein RodZ
MKRPSLAAAAAALMLVCLPATLVLAEDALTRNATPGTAATPAPAPAASPVVTTTTPAAATSATATEPAKESRKKQAKITRHNSVPKKPYEHFVGFDKMF